MVPEQGKNMIDDAIQQSSMMLIPNYKSLNFAQQAAARTKEIEKRNVHLKHNLIKHKSYTELSQFHHPLDVKMSKKRNFMVEVGVAHLPLISDGITPQRGFDPR